MSIATMGDRLSRLDSRLRRPDPGLPGFSLTRALKSALADRELDGAEAEISKELEIRAGRPPCEYAGARSAGCVSFFVPLTARVERRDLTTTGGVGALSTPTDATLLIDLIRNRSMVFQAGALLVPSMSGTEFRLPRVSAGSQVYWVTEGNSPTASNDTIGTVAFHPHTMAGWTNVTRSLQSQSGGTAAGIATRDLTVGLAVELDRVALSGSGIGAEPEGILNNTAVTTEVLGTNGGAPTRALVLAMEKDLGNASADRGSVAWFTTPNGRAAMRAVEVSTGSGEWLWSDEDTVLSDNYPGFATRNLPSSLVKGSGTGLSPLILGNWEDLAIGTWGAIALTLDKFSLGTAGGLRITAFWDVDVHPRNVASFVRCVDMIAP